MIDKLAWIKLQRSKFEQQPRQSERELAAGKSHYVFGRRYRLRVHEAEGKPRVAVRGIASLDLFVRPGASQEQRAAVLDRWYREQLKALVAPMFTTWQDKLGVQASAWGVKRMKTKWGSRTPASRRVWLNSELVKKAECVAARARGVGLLIAGGGCCSGHWGYWIRRRCTLRSNLGALLDAAIMLAVCLRSVPSPQSAPVGVGASHQPDHSYAPPAGA